MSALVATLEIQHRSIVATASAIEHALTTGDVAAVAHHLAQLKTQLAAHLELETTLYPLYRAWQSQ